MFHVTGLQYSPVHSIHYSFKVNDEFLYNIISL